MAKVKGNSIREVLPKKDVYLNHVKIGQAKEWDDVSILCCDFATDLFGVLFHDGRNYIAKRSAAEDHMLKAFGREPGKSYLLNTNTEETPTRFQVWIGDPPKLQEATKQFGQKEST
jgi:hypothetical protein